MQLDTRDARVIFLDREQDEGQSMNMNEERPLEEELDTASNCFIPDEMHNEIEFEELARHGSQPRGKLALWAINRNLIHNALDELLSKGKTHV